MALTIHLPDKILAGLHQSYTITSDLGPPTVLVKVGSDASPSRLIPLGPPKDAEESTTVVMKYKVSFFLPDDASGKTLEIEVESGGSKISETQEIVDA